MYYYPNSAGSAYMTQPTQSMLSPSPQQGLKGRPVSSLEEVRAAQIDFDGSLFVFPDIAHNRIYTKQISMDGSASLNMYELSQIPSSTAPIETNNFVTREEFKTAMAKLQEVFSKSGNEENKELPQFNF